MTALYRKLPGTLRGFLNRSSVWAGPGYLLLVRGSRFTEEYKRFYFRDVQAIAVARAPRFHVSTRMAFAAGILAALWFAARLKGGSYALPAIEALAVALVAVWIYVSAAQSCLCRIYTAVSGDQLPSIYRMWTARKFLAAVEPLIAQTQGVVERAWAAAAEEREVGPAFLAAAAHACRGCDDGRIRTRRIAGPPLFVRSVPGQPATWTRWRKLCRCRRRSRIGFRSSRICCR